MAKGAGRHEIAVAAAVTALAVTAGLYWRAVGLPFYSDDLLQVLWVRETPLLAFWCSVSPYGDYRPLHFTLWKLLVLSGLLTPSVAHALNLLGHALCGALVGVLAGRWSRRPLAASALAAALFSAFPFATDAVVWASSFSYPLAVALALGGILLGAGGDDVPRGAARYATSLALVALAGFAQEAGVAAGPAAFLAALLMAPRPGFRRAWPYLAASVVPLACVLYFAPAGTAYSLDVGHWGTNLGAAIQAIAYPLVPIFSWSRRLGAAVWLLVVVGLVAAVGALAWSAARARQARLFALGLAWAMLWSAVPLMTQRFDWVRDPPRVLYAGAAGVALLWTAGLTALGTSRRAAVRLALAVTVAVAALAPAAVFVYRTVGLYARAGDVLWRAIGAAGEGSPVLLVNLPGRITPPARMYPLGHEGVIPMPPPSDADLLVQVHTGRPAGAAFERAAGAILPPLPYGVELAGPPLTVDDIRAAGRVMVTTYRADGTIGLEEAGAVVPSAATFAPLARFGDALLLLSAECRRVGGRLTLTTTWRLESQAQGTPTVFAHLLDVDGRLVAQADGDPVRGLYRFVLWRQGETVRDVRVFEVAPPGNLTVAFGVWDPSAGARWPAVDANGVRLADDAVRCAVASSEDAAQ